MSSPRAPTTAGLSKILYAARKKVMLYLPFNNPDAALKIVEISGCRRRDWVLGNVGPAPPVHDLLWLPRHRGAGCPSALFGFNWDDPMFAPATGSSPFMLSFW